MENEIRNNIKRLKTFYVNIDEINDTITKLRFCINDIGSNNKGTLIDTMINALNMQIKSLEGIKNELINANNLITKKIRNLEKKLREILAQKAQDNISEV